MSEEITYSARARPLKIVFLVEEGERAQLILDAIFADCYSRWGGRFNPIVPCVNSRIDDRYWAWLETYDPDVVYSYVELSEQQILEIHERLCPSFYSFHAHQPPDASDYSYFRPTYGFKPLSSLSGIFRLARHSPQRDDGGRVKLIDSWFTEKSSRFLTDNFGTHHRSMGSGQVPQDALAAMRLVTIVSPEYSSDRRYGVPQNLDMIPTELEAFQEFSKRQVTSIALMSSMFSPRLEIQHPEFNHSFSLVVGESFADRILFWNSRLFLPCWLDGGFNGLRVSFEELNNPDLLSVIAAILNSYNRVNRGTGGNSQLSIRSASLTAEQIEICKKLLGASKVWGAASTKKLENLDELIPPAEAVSHAIQNAYSTGSIFDRRPSWSNYSTSPSKISQPPDHLSDLPTKHLYSQGYWMADVAISYPGLKTRYSGINAWTIPKRWRMARAFVPRFSHAPMHELPPQIRRNHDGYLSIPICSERTVESIDIPTAFQAVAYALAADGRDEYVRGKGSEIQPSNKVEWMKRSNEAMSLAGVLGLCGGLRNAIELLLHPYLISVFSKLGGSSTAPIESVGPTLNRLMKKGKSFDLTQDADQKALADLVVRAAQDVKSQRQFIGANELKALWSEYRRTFWESQPPQQPDDGSTDWDGIEQRSLDNCLIYMRKQKMLFQGYQWSCRNCQHRNWSDFTALSATPECEVCKSTIDAPVDFSWMFRANDFLIDSLRNRGVLSLIWALSALRFRARRSFLFVEPACFGYTQDYEKVDAEADLLVIIDGKAVLSEVKASWRSCKNSDIRKFVDLAKRLRPDIAVFAVMDKGIKFQEAINAVGAELKAVGTAFELLTLDQCPLEDDPYLHSGDAESNA